MAERLQKLVGLTFNTLTEGCPVYLDKGNLLVDTASNGLVLQLKLWNVSTKEIVDVFAKYAVFDSTSEEIERDLELAYLDQHIKPKCSFGERNPIFVPNGKARNVKITISKVAFVDGSTWHNDNAVSMTLNEQRELSAVFSPEDYALIRKEIQKCVSAKEQKEWHTRMPIECNEYWRCLCGQANEKEKGNCGRCGLSKQVIFSFISQESVNAMRIKHREEQKKAALQAHRDKMNAAKKARQKKKQNRIIVLVAGIIVALAGLALLFFNYMLPGIRYNRALDLLTVENYHDAISVFESLGDYGDSQERVKDCLVKSSLLAYENKDYENAIACLMEAGITDSEELQECYNGLAIEQFHNQNYENALESFLKASDKADIESFVQCIGCYCNTEAQKLSRTNFISNLRKIENATGSDKIVQECQYQRASVNVADMAYDEAIGILLGIDGYRDSQELLSECYYKKAKTFFDKKQYEEAIVTLGRIVITDSNKYDVEALQRLCDEAVQAEKTSFAKGYINGGSVNLRSNPSTDAEIVGEYSMNTAVEVVGVADDWYKVVVDGKTGYIKKKLISDEIISSQNTITSKFTIEEMKSMLQGSWQTSSGPQTLTFNGDICTIEDGPVSFNGTAPYKLEVSKNGRKYNLYIEYYGVNVYGDPFTGTLAHYLTDITESYFESEVWGKYYKK